MSYRVGIDFGTTFTAAAVHRDGEQAVELVPLGDNRASVPSVVFVAPDGGLFLPETLPDFSSDIGRLKALSYPELCFESQRSFSLNRSASNFFSMS